MAGVSALSAEAVATALREAGFPVTTRQLAVIGPPAQPPEREVSPLNMAVLVPQVRRTGSRLVIAVKLDNLGFTPLEAAYGNRTFIPVLEDEFGRPKRWTGNVIWRLDSLIVTIAPRGDAYIRITLPLDQFNPRFPLPPGRYRVKVVVQDLGLSAERGLTQPPGQSTRFSTTLTGPWLTVTP